MSRGGPQRVILDNPDPWLYRAGPPEADTPLRPVLLLLFWIGACAPSTPTPAPGPSTPAPAVAEPAPAPSPPEAEPFAFQGLQDPNLDGLFVRGDALVLVDHGTPGVAYRQWANPVHVQVFDRRGQPQGGFALGLTSEGALEPASEPGHYTLTPEASPASLQVTLPDGTALDPVHLVAHELPLPSIRLGGSRVGGVIGSGEFKAQAGVLATSPGVPVKLRHDIVGFSLVYLATRADAVESANQGPRFNDKSKRLVTRAKPGDRYVFTNIVMNRSGWSEPVTMPDLHFAIR